jgi:hypothetical protein
MGTLYSKTTGEGQEAVTDYIGFVYEDVDVTTGNMPASVVTKGVVYEDRLPAELTSAEKTALEAKGFVNAQGDKITETPSSKSTMMVSPSGFSISVSEHIRKED